MELRGRIISTNPVIFFVKGKFLRLGGSINAKIGDIAKITFEKVNNRIINCEILVNSSGVLTSKNLNILPQNYVLTKKRFDLIWKIREFFHNNGFTETATSIMKKRIAPEAHIKPLRLLNEDFLITSPELSLKRLLVEGFEKIFEITHAFRDDIKSSLHNKEFLIIEWYRAYCRLDAIMDDFVALLRYLANDDNITWQGKLIMLYAETISFEDAFKKAGFDLKTLDHYFENDKIYGTLSYFELVDYVFEQYVEPMLGKGQITFLVDFPEWKSSLAVVENGVTQRFEVFIEGIEIGNAFYELNDTAKQEKRFEKEEAELKKKDIYIKSDKEFLDALGWGMPNASGIAVGIDRLLLFFTDTNKIELLL